MGRGLVTVTLEAIKAQAWTVKGEPLSGESVAALYEAIPEKSAMCAAVQERYVGGYSGGRRWDRALAVLKRAGLVRWNRVERCWEKVGS